MDSLTLALGIFVALETLNIGILYFAPHSRMGNGVGVFKAYAASEADPAQRALIRYLVNWVAGTKLIFVALLLVILATGSVTTRLLAVGVLIPAILTFYWRLYPAIREMDAAGWIEPPGYARTLGWMIAAFVAGFVVALGVFVAGGGTL